MWPDFREDHFKAAILEFRGRERRFGRTGEQVSGVGSSTGDQKTKKGE
jgi:undecaprenyl diphosphate synthase